MTTDHPSEPRPLTLTPQQIADIRKTHDSEAFHRTSSYCTVCRLLANLDAARALPVRGEGDKARDFRQAARDYRAVRAERMTNPARPVEPLTAEERAEIEAWADWHENHPPHTMDSDTATQYVRRLLDAARATPDAETLPSYRFVAVGPSCPWANHHWVKDGIGQTICAACNGKLEPIAARALPDAETLDVETWDKMVRALGSFLWLGNNLHNAGTDTFREMYEASLADARRAYEAGAARLRERTEPEAER